MSWNIVYSEQARKDLRNIFEYIAYELLVPDDMPLRHHLYEEEPWHSMGIRFFPVDNYLVFYLPNETEGIVNIVRIMYGGRDIRKQLSNTIKF